MSVSLSELAEELAMLEQGIRDANLTRYISGSGLVLLMYDHLLTLSDEASLVWAARSSVAKKLFLINRYMVLASQLGIAYHMNQFGGNSLPDKQCEAVISLVFVYGIISLACANFLVLLRVISLWDRNATVVKLMLMWFVACEASAFGFMVLVLTQAAHTFKYSELVHSCIVTYKSRELPAVWAASLLFDVAVMVAVVSNALYRPRSHDTPLRRVLIRDGIFYFVTIALMRLANTIIAVVARAELTPVAVFFVWSMTTTVLNRSLFRIQKVAISARERTGSMDAGRSSVGALSAVMSKSSISSTADALSSIPMTRMSSGGTGGVRYIAGIRRERAPSSRPGTADSDVKDEDVEAFALPVSENVMHEDYVLQPPTTGAPWSVRFSTIGRYNR